MKAKELIRLGRWLLFSEFSFQDGVFENAARVFRWALELEPDNVDAQWLLAQALIKTGETDEARPLLEKIAEDTPDSLAALAVARAAGFDFAGAKRACDRALEIDPADFRQYANRGLFHFHMGDYDAAAGDLARAVLLGHPHALAELSFGTTLGSGDFGPIFQGFPKIREETGPSRAFRLIDVWVAVVRAFDAPARAKALKLWRRLPEKERETWEALALRACFERFRTKGDYLSRKRRVGNFVRRALATAPGDTGLTLGLIAEGAPDHAEEADAYETVLRVAKDWTKGWETAVRVVLYNLKDPARAGPLLDRKMELEEEISDHETRARIHLGLGRYEEALAVLEAIEGEFLPDPGAAEEAEEEEEEEEEDDDEDDFEDEDEDDLDEEEDDEDEEEEEDEPGVIYMSDEWFLANYLALRAKAKLRLRDLEGARADHDLAVPRAGVDQPRTYVGRAWFRAIVGDRRGALEDLDHAIAAVEHPPEDWTKRRDRWRAKGSMGERPRADRG